MNFVAKLLEMPPMRVYEVATFYTMFNRCALTLTDHTARHILITRLRMHQRANRRTLCAGVHHYTVHAARRVRDPGRRM